MQNHLFLFFVLAFLPAGFTSHELTAESQQLKGGFNAEAEDIPSAWWPVHVVTSIELESKETGKTVKEGSRGTLLRVENDLLVVDFGRFGVRKVSPKKTDFFDQVSHYMMGKETKEFANFALQIGNKLVDFGSGKDSGPIRFDDVKETKLYVLVYVDNYEDDQSEALKGLSAFYEELRADYADILFVLMPSDKNYYDFSLRTKSKLPLIAPHMRIGYMKSLTHGNVEDFPFFVLVDANGRVLKTSEKQLPLNKLQEKLVIALQEIGFIP